MNKMTAAAVWAGWLLGVIAGCGMLGLAMGAETHVDGFAKLVQASGQDNYFTTHRGPGTMVAYITMGADTELVRWESAPVPAQVGERVVFAWDTAMSGKYNQGGGYAFIRREFPADLYLNGKKLVTLRTVLTGDTKFTQGQPGGADYVELFFDFLRPDDFVDLCGIMYLSVPAALVVPGQPVTFELRPGKQRGGAWLGVIPKTDTWAFAATVKNNPTESEMPAHLKKPVTVQNTAKAVAPEVAAQELAKWQRRVVGERQTTFVNGVSRIMLAASRGEYNTGRGALRKGESGPSAWAYTREGETVIWETAPAPEKVATPLVTFAWDVMMTSGNNENIRDKKGPFTFKLSVNGERLLSFESAQFGDQRWQSEDGTGELFFDYYVFDLYNDLGGVMFLTLPAARVTAGQPLTMQMDPDNCNAKVYTMITAFGDTVALLGSGEIKENPDRFVGPKELTRDDFYYDGSGYLKVPDPKGGEAWDGMDEVLTRGHFRVAGAMNCERVIFRDTYTRVEKWRLTRLHAKHGYSTILCFNANAELLQLAEYGGLPNRYYDMWRARPVDWAPKAGGCWDRVRPYTVYYGKTLKGGWGKSNEETEGEIWRGDVKTGEGKRLAASHGQGGLGYVMSDDGNFVFWVQMGGQDTGYLVGSCDYEGNNYHEVNVGGGIHQAYLVREPIKRGQYWLYCHNANTVDDKGKVIGGGHHSVVDLVTGKKPIPAFAGVHEGHSPDGWAVFSGYASSMYADRMPPHTVVRVMDNMEVHTSWNSFEHHWAAESYNTNYGSSIVKCNPWTDDACLVGNSNQQCPEWLTWSTMQFANLSPDGTKILYYSSMLDGAQCYILVAKSPEAPVAVKAERVGKDVRVQWTLHELAREIRHYFVLRSPEAGKGFTVVGGPVVGGAEFVDQGAPAGPLFYRVRAQENSGLVSPFSAAAGVDAAKEPQWLECEAESGRNTPPLRVVQDGRCVGGHLVWVAPFPKDRVGKLALEVPVAAAGKYHLWVRAAAVADGKAQVTFGGRARELTLTKSDWAWYALGDGDLAVGAAPVAVESGSVGVCLDRFVLSTDAQARPTGLGLIDAEAPPAPAGLTVAEAKPNSAQLRWTASPARDVRYYNLYAAAEPKFECVQSRLALSVPGEDTTACDWGLPAGKAHYYQLTAVDADGNESVPSAVLKVDFPALPNPVQVTVALNQAAGITTEAVAGAADGKAVAPVSQFRVPVQVPGDQPSELIVWVRGHKVKSLHSPQVRVSGKGSSVTMTFGGDNGATQRWKPFWFWTTNPSARLRLQPGANELTITTSQVHVDQMILTTDPGFKPNGTVDHTLNWPR